MKKRPMYKIVTVFCLPVIFLLQFQTSVTTIHVTDFSRVCHGSVDSVLYPRTVEQLRDMVMQADKPISIVGGNYSMGGQTWMHNGIAINMQYINAITSFDLQAKTVTVQAGALWADLQAFLYPYALTVQVMQSYNDFSIGGSLSVNVHGRDPLGQIITTVDSVTVMLADGSLVKASRTENQELFSAVIGGYGACGIIVSATLFLQENYHIKREITSLDSHEFIKFYTQKIALNPNVALFNANIYDLNFDAIVAITWYKTDEPLTIFDLSIVNKKKMPRISALVPVVAEYILGEFSSARQLRFLMDDKIAKYKDYIVLRSYEMSHSIKSLAGSTNHTSKILQEYFIPEEDLYSFLFAMKKIFVDNQVKVLNISIRHVPGNTESLLSYAPQDCFAFVCYIAIDNNSQGHAHTALWTQALINSAIQCHGSYYLPYHLFASASQFMQCYPLFPDLLRIKNYYDPSGIFQNTLISQCQNYYK